MAENSAIEWTDAVKRLARTVVNVEVRFGRMPRPNDLPCVDCGHIWRPGERRHEYDHHRGYDVTEALSVQSVCTRCQRRRSIERGEIKIANLRRAASIRSAERRTHCALGHPMSRHADGKWRCRECRLIYWRERNKRGRKH